MWCVAMTKPGSEHIAKANLERQGYVTYLPRYRYAKPGQKTRVLSLFPRYIFVWVDQFWVSITGTVGVSRLLMADGKPATILTEIIENLKAKEDKRGFISLTEKPKFEAGDKVKVADGVLSGYPMVVESMTGSERVKVLIEMLGRKVSVTLPEKTVVAA